MIEFPSGIKFVRSKNKNLAAGEYKVYKNKIIFALADDFVVLIANRYGETFFVSASKQDGKYHYLFSTSSAHDQKMGFNLLSYSQKANLAKEIWRKNSQKKELTSGVDMVN